MERNSRSSLDWYKIYFKDQKWNVSLTMKRSYRKNGSSGSYNLMTDNHHSLLFGSTRIYLLIILIIPIIIRAEIRCSHTVYSNVCLSLSDRPSTSFSPVFRKSSTSSSAQERVDRHLQDFSVSPQIKGPFFSSNISSSINFNWVLIHPLQKRSTIIIICITQSTASNFLFILFLLLHSVL